MTKQQVNENEKTKGDYVGSNPQSDYIYCPTVSRTGLPQKEEIETKRK